MSSPTTLLPFQPATTSTAQLAAVSFLARYPGRIHHVYAVQRREWFTWCESNRLDPLIWVQRAHVELYIGSLDVRGLMDSTVVSMMKGVRGLFRFAAHAATSTGTACTSSPPTSPASDLSPPVR